MVHLPGLTIRLRQLRRLTHTAAVSDAIDLLCPSHSREGCRVSAFYQPDVHAHLLVAAYWRERIIRGELRPGDRIPSAASMAAQLDISREVANNALQVLRREGFTEAHRGRGTWVRARPPIEVVDMTVRDEGTEKTVARLAAKGQAVAEVRDRVATRLPTADEAASLGTPESQPVFVITREYVNDERVVVHTDEPRLLAGESSQLAYKVDGR